jgi:hypothetical protein
MIPKLMITLAVSCGLGSVALAKDPHTSGLKGQPNQSCEVSMVMPGHSASAPGSAFNPNGIAGTKYAGTQPQNSKNPKSVSQYDVACFQQSQKKAKSTPGH